MLGNPLQFPILAFSWRHPTVPPRHLCQNALSAFKHTLAPPHDQGVVKRGRQDNACTAALPTPKSLLGPCTNLHVWVVVGTQADCFLPGKSHRPIISLPDWQRTISCILWSHQVLTKSSCVPKLNLIPKHWSDTLPATGNGHQYTHYLIAPCPEGFRAHTIL